GYNDDTPCTALARACYYGHLEAVRCLIDHGANIHLRDPQGNLPPLARATYSDNIEIARLLLERGATEKEEALTKAAFHNRTAVAEFLLDQGADVNGTPGSERFPLLNATAWGHIEMVRLLLQYNANVDRVHSEYVPGY